MGLFIVPFTFLGLLNLPLLTVYVLIKEFIALF